MYIVVTGIKFNFEWLKRYQLVLILLLRDFNRLFHRVFFCICASFYLVRTYARMTANGLTGVLKCDFTFLTIITIRKWIWWVGSGCHRLYTRRIPFIAFRIMLLKSYGMSKKNQKKISCKAEKMLPGIFCISIRIQFCFLHFYASLQKHGVYSDLHV